MEVDGVRYAVSAAAPDGLRTARRLRYFGHFPVADIQAELPGDLHVAVRAWSPFIPGDAAASNTPAAGFDVWLRNEGIATRRGWLQFASPGGPEAQPAAAAWSRGDALGATAAAWRDGREFGYVVAALGNPAAVVVEADVPTIGVPFDLPPGGTARLRFVLAWCYPHFTTSDSHPRTHRYARSFADAGEAAAYLAAHWDGLLRRIRMRSPGRLGRSGAGRRPLRPDGLARAGVPCTHRPWRRRTRGAGDPGTPVAPSSARFREPVFPPTLIPAVAYASSASPWNQPTRPSLRAYRIPGYSAVGGLVSGRVRRFPDRLSVVVEFRVLVEQAGRHGKGLRPGGPGARGGGGWGVSG